MKQEEVHAVAHKLLAADQVIHEQQLGWQWQGPDEDALLAGPHSPTQGTRTLTGSKKKSASQKASSEVGDAEEMSEGEPQNAVLMTRLLVTMLLVRILTMINNSQVYQPMLAPTRYVTQQMPVVTRLRSATGHPPNLL